MPRFTETQEFLFEGVYGGTIETGLLSWAKEWPGDSFPAAPWHLKNPKLSGRVKRWLVQVRRVWRKVGRKVNEVGSIWM